MNRPSKKKSIAIFVLLIVFSWSLAIPGLATPMTGGSYSITSFTISSGGRTDLTSPTGNYKMLDNKGEPAIGWATASGNGLGLGAIYGEVVGWSMVPPGSREDPYVRNIRIRRVGPNEGDALRILFDLLGTYDGRRIYLWRYPTTEAGTYQERASLWGNIDSATFPSGASSDRSFTVSGQVRTGDPQAYYRVESGGIGTALAGLPVVGKVNLRILGNMKYSLISIPFIQEDNSWNTVFGDQLDAGNLTMAHLIFGWDGTGFSYGIKRDAAGTWSNFLDNMPCDRGLGYFVYSQPGTADRFPTIVGKVVSLEYEAWIGDTTYTLIGDPFPLRKDLKFADFGESGATSGYLADADQIFGWDGTGYGLSNYFSGPGSSWSPIAASTDLEVGKGYFYYVKTSGRPPSGRAFDWRFNPYAD